ncbi:hypothetical protein [aff. Roholtiella sp. LEGE 12411]|nr:hypothetical protein [aff. Roholtiella sp. LEGE 12411]
MTKILRRLANTPSLHHAYSTGILKGLLTKDSTTRSQPARYKNSFIYTK